MSSNWCAVVLVVAFVASAAEPPAEAMTWQEANKRSAELVQKRRNPAEAADLAARAFDLYGQQIESYSARSHAQLLLNAVAARRAADGQDAARDQLERGIAVITQRTGPSDPVLVGVWREGASLFAASSRENTRYNEKALAVAEKAWGQDDPRTISVFMSAVHDQRRARGYAWTHAKFKMARERAVKGGEDSALVAEIDLLLAKIEMESGKKDLAVEKYKALIARLEPRTDDQQEETLLKAYALLEYLHGERNELVSAQEIRDRRVARQHRPDAPSIGNALDPNALVPAARVAPEYPRQALKRRQEGTVDVELRVNPDGTVADAKILRSDPPGVFDDAALRAIRKWKFKPKMVDDKAVEATGTQRMEFRLR